MIAASNSITESIQRIVNEGQGPKLEGDDTEQDVDGDIFALAKRVHSILQNIRESNKNNTSQKKQR